MIDLSLGPSVRCDGVVRTNEPVSSGLLRLDLDLDQSLTFQPGQFAMLNLVGAGSLVFSRPFSIFEIDGWMIIAGFVCEVILVNSAIREIKRGSHKQRRIGKERYEKDKRGHNGKR